MVCNVFFTPQMWSKMLFLLLQSRKLSKKMGWTIQSTCAYRQKNIEHKAQHFPTGCLDTGQPKDENKLIATSGLYSPLFLKKMTKF